MAEGEGEGARGGQAETGLPIYRYRRVTAGLSSRSVCRPLCGVAASPGPRCRRPGRSCFPLDSPLAEPHSEGLFQLSTGREVPGRRRRPDGDQVGVLERACELVACGGCFTERFDALLVLVLVEPIP